jgi:hypothetical protein
VWQKCGAYGPQKYTYHDASGNPVVDSAKVSRARLRVHLQRLKLLQLTLLATLQFPDFKKMTNLAHSLGLTAGWYGNNCDCHDHCTSVECFAGDVNATLVRLSACCSFLRLLLIPGRFFAGVRLRLDQARWLRQGGGRGAMGGDVQSQHPAFGQCLRRQAGVGNDDRELPYVASFLPVTLLIC